MVTTTYDGANRAVTLSGVQAGETMNYITQTAYLPHGAPNYYVYGNNVWPVWSYNSRLQLSNTYATIGNNGNNYLLYLGYSWGQSGASNNGTLYQVSVATGNSAPWSGLTWWTQTFTYDNVNRLNAASDSGGWSRNFGYDAYGNMWVPGNSGVALAGNTPTANVFTASNQISGGSYDTAGNQLTVNGNSTAYDAENRMKSVTDPPAAGGAVETYSYDGLGQRVQKAGPGGTATFVYDALGQLAAEYWSTSQQASPCWTCYLVADHLGTTRLVTDEDGNVIARHDYLPFGRRYRH